MAQEVTIGGDRLGAGGKVTQELYNYGMNSFNQERDWKSPMAPGILYPCFKEIGTNHGTFDIDVDSFVRTLPTKGPLFASFKMQVDFFNVPFRLYQGILHNNPIDIGLNMHQVYLPKLMIETIDGKTAPRLLGSNDDTQQINNSALLKYTGLSGIGHKENYTISDGTIKRKIQCIPELGYYDIFKNYYSNKQEENAYVITPGTPEKANVFHEVIQGNVTEIGDQIIKDYKDGSYNENDLLVTKENVLTQLFQLVLEKSSNSIDYKSEVFIASNEQGSDLNDLESDGIITTDIGENEKYITISIQIINWQAFIDWATETESSTELQTKIKFVAEYDSVFYTSSIELSSFALKNIDKMRAKLLACNELGEEFSIINDNEAASNTDWGIDSGVDNTGLPYSALVKTTEEGITWNAFKQNGLVVKTYQSDLFNNWLDNTFITTIQNRVKIDTTSGGFTPDTLILQEKIYKLLNRILVSGGTYYDWQEATYGEGVARMCEIPLYIGGMSAEIMFEEVISNSDTVTAQAGYQPLGSLGGKGTIAGKKGGNNIHVRMDEPGYIMGIVSITPRICYNQGNDWDRTELNTLDDLHKPELDQIGFQDMMVEQLAWWNVVLRQNSGVPYHRDSYGKQIAWINYQTAIDKSYGDFAETDGYGFMVLNRNYEHGDHVFAVKDITTYIDPAKYNYAFAYANLDATNFWVQLHFKVTSRRKMGAQQLPNL